MFTFKYLPIYQLKNNNFNFQRFPLLHFFRQKDNFFLYSQKILKRLKSQSLSLGIGLYFPLSNHFQRIKMCDINLLLKNSVKHWRRQHVFPMTLTFVGVCKCLARLQLFLSFFLQREHLIQLSLCSHMPVHLVHSLLSDYPSRTK